MYIRNFSNQFKIGLDEGVFTQFRAIEVVNYAFCAIYVSDLGYSSFSLSNDIKITRIKW